MILLSFNIIKNRSDFKSEFQLNEKEIISITENNVASVLRILEQYNILSTFFVEISIVEKMPALLKKIVGLGHEISLYHENSTINEIENSKHIVEKLIEKIVRGIRQKELVIPIEELKLLEFSYISNIENAEILFPLKRLKRGTEIFQNKGLSIIPESISPYSQIPYNDFVFQILPLKFYQSMVTETIKNEDFVVIYLNSWQFTDYDKLTFKIPFYRKYNSGRKMEDKLESFCQWINENEFACSRMKDFIF